MTGPVGFSTSSDKKLEYGWSREADDDQFFERLTRNILQLDGEVHHQFGHDPDGTRGLDYYYFGGIVDDGAAWSLQADGYVTLPDDSGPIYIERDLGGGGVVQNIIGWTYVGFAPMAEVTTRAGEIVNVLDRRPHDTEGGGGGGGGGCVTFPCLAGVILDAQVPLTAVKQHEAFLAIAFTQLTGSIADGQVPESAVTQHQAALSLSFTQMFDFLTEDQVADADQQLGERIIGSTYALSELVGYLLSRVAALEAVEIPEVTVPPPFESLDDLLNFLLNRATRPMPHELIAGNYSFV